MDPIAHTLVGAALAEAGLKRLSRYASATLIIGANLPDIDVIAQFWGEDMALYIRRGWSHGILAMLVLPFLLTGLLWLWHRWRGGHQPDAPLFRPHLILALAFIGVWSHPLLDWLNTYGVRLLMPFSETWFYGNTLFIVDPWFWLLSGAGLVLACRHSKALLGWALLAGMATFVILSTALAPPLVKIFWLVSITAIALLRWRAALPGLWTNRVGLATLTLYIGVAYGLARLAEGQYESETQKEHAVQANPLPGNPFHHRVVTVTNSHYRIIKPDGKVIEAPRYPPNQIVRKAMDSDAIKGFMNWTRFPYWQVREKADSWVVEFRDLRYLDPEEKPRGIGFAKVELSKAEISNLGISTTGISNTTVEKVK